VSLLRDCEEQKPSIPWKSAIKTYDNLNYEVLEEILAIVGCNQQPYESKKAFIDERLLRHRNCIAHNGHDHDFDVEDFSDLYSGVSWLME
jgi:hypothetical protein